MEDTKQNAERDNSLRTPKTELQNCFGKWKQYWEKGYGFQERGDFEKDVIAIDPK